MYKLCPRCDAEVPFPLESTEENPVLECRGCGHRFPWFEDAFTPLAPGDLIGRYELVEILGSGGYGVVWRARDLDLQRDVAVKFLNREIITHRDKARFLREARTAANLKHPHIVAVHHVGEHAVRRPAGQRDGEPLFEELPPQLFIVSELVRGEGLDCRMQAGPPPTPRQAVATLTPIAEALAAAHAAGVVHRDVKPSNVMVDGSGSPFLLDFGISKTDAAAPTMTQDGAVIGSVGYMSPEQARGENQNIDARTDVFAFGVVLFELLTGRLPFTGTAAQIQLAVADPTRDAPRLRSVNPSLPRDLETICARCLEKDPERRFPTAQELADELRRYLEGLPILSRPISVWERAIRWRRRNPAAAALSAAVLLILLIAGAGSAYLNRDRASLSTAVKKQQSKISAQQAQIAVKEKEVQEKSELAATEAQRATTSEERRAWQRYVQDVQGMEAAWEAGEIERLHELLDRHNPARGATMDYRGVEWRYWDRLLRASAKVFKTAAACRSLAFSPDGRYLAACDETAVTLWDLNSGVQKSRWNIAGGRHSRVVDITDQRSCDFSVAFSQDGKLIAATCFHLQRDRRSGSVRVWDVESGIERFAALNDRHLGGRAVAFSPDGQYVCAGGYLNHWKCWRLDTGEQELPQVRPGIAGARLIAQPHEGTPWDGSKVVWNLGFSPDGKTLYAGCQWLGLDFWNWPELDRRGIHHVALGIRRPKVDGVVDFPQTDGPRFYFLEDGWLNVLQPGRPRLDRQFNAAWDEQRLNDRNYLTCVAASGHLFAAGGQDKLVRVWSLAMNPISKDRDLVGHLGAVECLAFGPGEMLASADARREIRVWPPGDPRVAQWPVFGDARHPSSARAGWSGAGGAENLGFLVRSGAVVAVMDGNNHVLTFRQEETGRVLGTVAARRDDIVDVRFSPDERFAAVAFGERPAPEVERLILWDLEGGREVRTFESPYLRGSGCMAFQPQGTLFAWSNGRRTHLVDRATGSEVRVLPGGGRHLNFSPSGRLAAIDEGRAVTVWSVESGEKLQSIQPQMSSRSAAAFDHSDTQLVIVGGRIELRDVATGAVTPAAFGDEPGEDAAFTRDGRRLYVVAKGGRTVNIYCTLTGHRTLRLPCRPAVSEAESLEAMFEKLTQQWNGGRTEAGE